MVPHALGGDRNRGHEAERLGKIGEEEPPADRVALGELLPQSVLGERPC